MVPAFEMFAIGQEEEGLPLTCKEEILRRDSEWAGHGTMLGEGLWSVFIIQMGSLM